MDHISPEHLSYIVGFLQGDGNNYAQSRNRGRISAEISLRDIDILDKIESCMRDIYVGRSERKRDTNFRGEYESCKLSVFDEKARKYLSQYIPVGNKSSRIRPPIKAQFFRKSAYIRGLYDADGSIGMTAQNRPFWSLCTSSEYVKDFVLCDIKDNLNFEKRINRNKRDGVYNIVLYDEDAIEYTKLLYANATIFLDRKYNKYLELLGWVRSIPKCKGKKKSWISYEDKLVLDDSISLRDKMSLLCRSRSSIVTRLWRLRQQ
jgi:hypothetical protein